MEDISASFNKARQYAFLLLKFRPRSSKEIFGRLKKKNFDLKIIKEVICFLEEKRFLDDNEFTRAWVESRLARGYGFKRIVRELGLKGIDRQIIDSNIQEKKKHYSEDQVLNCLVEQKWHRLKALPPQKAKQRLFGFLARRGFSTALIIEAIEGLE